MGRDSLLIINLKGRELIRGSFNLETQMGCFNCLSPNRRKHNLHFEDANLIQPPSPSIPDSPGMSWKRKSNASCDTEKSQLSDFKEKGSAHSFTFSELAAATKKFREANLIGEGGFGKVYHGYLENGQEIAAKQLNFDSLQGNKEFIVEVLMLSLLHHPNLVTLIGYCAEGEQRILVYEYMPMGTVADHLYQNTGQLLDWNTRMKIALGAARGLEYLHCKANPPVIYRDLKSANILLDKDFNPKLSDFGLAKLGPIGDKSHVSTRVMGTYGYCAPDYAMSGKLTLKSDIFSFGVVLLELITGRRAFDPSKRQGEQSLVAWARDYLKRKSVELIDPRLQGKFYTHSARRLIFLISLCLSEAPNARPPVSEIVEALEFLVKEGQKHGSGGKLLPVSASGVNQEE